ncbi:hypothetical protein ACE1SV_00870 [Streptomyces sennicomposti]
MVGGSGSGDLYLSAKARDVVPSPVGPPRIRRRAEEVADEAGLSPASGTGGEGGDREGAVTAGCSDARKAGAAGVA